MSDDYITVKKILQNKSRVEITKKEKKKKKHAKMMVRGCQVP